MNLFGVPLTGPQLFWDWENQWDDEREVDRKDFKHRRFKMTVESVRYFRPPVVRNELASELHCEVVLLAEFVLRRGEKMKRADVPLASIVLQHIFAINEYLPNANQSYPLAQNPNMPAVSLMPNFNAQPEPPPQLTWQFIGHPELDCPKARLLISVCKRESPPAEKSFPFTLRLYRMGVKVHNKHWKTGWSELTGRDFRDAWKFTITDNYNEDAALQAGFVPTVP